MSNDVQTDDTIACSLAVENAVQFLIAVLNDQNTKNGANAVYNAAFCAMTKHAHDTGSHVKNAQRVRMLLGIAGIEND